MEMSNFPNCTAAGLEIVHMCDYISENVCPSLKRERCSVIRAADVERLLKQGVRVYGRMQAPSDLWTMQQLPADTSTALLIGIRPTVRDTAEGLLREIVKMQMPAPHTPANGALTPYGELLERARRLAYWPWRF